MRKARAALLIPDGPTCVSSCLTPFFFNLAHIHSAEERVEGSRPDFSEGKLAAQNIFLKKSMVQTYEPHPS